MGCNTCHQKVCCCEKRISLKGKKGHPGPKGISTPGQSGIDGTSCYVYIAYATNVVPGSPDVVTGFTLTTPECWIATITSPTPLIPVEADFQGQWKEICAAAPSPCACCTGFYVEITGAEIGDSLSAAATGGAGPYTFEWSVVQNNNSPTLNGVTQNASTPIFVGAGPAVTAIVVIGAPTATNYLWQCKVTDDEGCVYIAYYLNVTP